MMKFRCRTRKKMHLRKLLWIDAIAAFSSGCIVMILVDPLSDLLNLPVALLRTLSVISFVYAPYSFYLAMRRSISERLTKLLVAANSLYATTCLILLALFFDTASLWGIGYFLLDFSVVLLLALLEWKQLRLVSDFQG
jgi:hypothetical protein